MSYTIENGMWRSVFAVPADIVDSHLKLCGEVPLKVLLALLRYNGGLDTPALSSIVGKPEPVVKEALEYLISAGIIQDPSGAKTTALVYEEVAGECTQTVAEAPERKITTVSTARRRFARDEINSLAEADETVAWLLQESQTVLGKTLNAVATDTIVALYSYYGMKPDIIMMVLQYCVGVGKASMGYIEKVAATWLENGIETHVQAEAEIKRQMESHSTEGKIKSAFGIHDRSLTQNEKKYVPVWLNDYGFDVPAITVAYERCVDVKGKLSFPYINGILTNWHTKGIHTPAEALRDISESSAKRAAEAERKTKTASYDLNELEELLNQGTL